MKCLRWLGGDRFEIQNGIPDSHSPLCPHDVLLRVKAVGICKSDIHIQEGRFPWARPPLILGHEIAGEVESVGASVTRVKRGARVTCDCVVGCGQCAYCHRHQAQFCKNGYELGFSRDGGCQEFVILPEQNVYPVGASVSMEEAAILDMEVYAAINKPGVRRGETVLVIGPGPAGLIAVQIVRRLGAGKVLLSGNTDFRLQVGLQLGVDRIIDIRKEHFVEVIREETKGMGADLVIDCAGTTDSFHHAIDAVTPGGRVILYGVYPAQVPEARLAEIIFKDLVVFGSLSDREGWDVVISWAEQGRLNLKPLITHTFPIEEGARAYNLVRDEPQGFVKAVLLL